MLKSSLGSTTSMPSNSDDKDTKYISPIRILIPAALTSSSAKHTLYSVSIDVRPVAQQWTVNRRYSQFLTLRNELIQLLQQQPSKGCPGCQSFCDEIHQFDFPKKHWVHSNRIIRGRVSSLQKFLKLIMSRAFDDRVPKCYTCGVSALALLRPFLLRGAQPIGASDRDAIHSSLSFQAYRRDENIISWASTAQCSSMEGEGMYERLSVDLLPHLRQELTR